MGPSAKSKSTSGTSPPRVLVVEDYPDGRDLYAEYLSYAGYAVEVATTGEEAVEKAIHGLPDVILMDLSLPVMSGFEATRILKADPRTRDIPVMALSGHVIQPGPANAIAAGCDDFMGKPAMPAEVEQRIRELLRGRKRT